MDIKHPFVKPEIECTLAAGCAVTGEPFAIELAHVKGRLTMVSAKPIKAGGGSGGLKPALTSLDLSDGMDTGRTYHCPHCGNSGAVSGTIQRIEVQRVGVKAEPGVKREPGVKAEPGYPKRGPRW